MTQTPTTGSKVGIVYVTATGHVRGHIYVDSDSEWPAIQSSIASTPGLSIGFVPMSDHMAGPDQFYGSIATLLNHPNATWQFTAPQCAVVDNTSLLVENVIMADATFDTIPGKTLINDTQCQVGFSWSPISKQFTTVQVVLPIKPGRATAVTIPATSYAPSGPIGVAAAAVGKVA